MNLRLIRNQFCEDTPEAERIFKKWELDFAIIGKTTDTGRLIVQHKGETVADMPVDALSEEARRRAPLAREVEIDDVGSLCVFLVSDAAQAITGDVHYVDGGFHILA